MLYLALVALLALLGSGLAWRVSHGHWRLFLPVLGGFMGGAWFGLQPILFRAENGPVFSVLVFGVPAALVGLLIGFFIQALLPDGPATGHRGAPP